MDIGYLNTLQKAQIRPQALRAKTTYTNDEKIAHLTAWVNLDLSARAYELAQKPPLPQSTLGTFKLQYKAGKIGRTQLLTDAFCSNSGY